jgi:hypothetical protein
VKALSKVDFSISHHNNSASRLLLYSRFLVAPPYKAFSGLSLIIFLILQFPVILQSKDLSLLKYILAADGEQFTEYPHAHYLKIKKNIAAVPRPLT